MKKFSETIGSANKDNISTNKQYEEQQLVAEYIFNLKKQLGLVEQEFKDEVSRINNSTESQKDEYPKPPTVDEVLSVLQEDSNELVHTQTEEKTHTPTYSETKQNNLITKSVDEITKQVKLEEKKDSFQQPNPALVEKNLEAIQNKLKFLEQAIGKIATHGPGSGEVRFLNLDDVNYNSWQDRDTHKLLRYKPSSNPAYDEVYFDFLSGDQGPIYSLKFDENGYTNNANVATGLVAWNSERDCLDVHQTNGTICQVGLENYIRVYNDSNTTLENGTFTVFTGVKDSNIEAPTVGGFLANTTCLPLLSVGVATSDISSNSLGKVTTLGEVRGVDASGASAGNNQPEVWNIGDLLWASPSHAGKLTKYQPTAPNVAVSVAAVVDNNNTSGIFLVRPTIFPRLYYAEFSSDQNQTAPNTNFGHKLTFNNTLTTSGFNLNQGNTEIAVQNTGLYNVRCKVQFSSTNASQQTFYMWGRKNNVDIPDSTIKVSSSGNGFLNAPIWSRNVSCQAGDKLSIMWAVSSTDVSLVASTTNFTPNTSSAVFSIFQIDL